MLIELIARQPERSDRQIARSVGVDHKTISTARAKGEDVGSIPHVETRTDTKGRDQPAKKSKLRPDAELKAKQQKPIIRQDLIDQAMAVIKSMDHDTWERFDKIYAKARPNLNTVLF